MEAIAQNATQLSVSTPTDIDFAELVERNAKKSVKGITRERLLLNNSKLMHSCRMEYKTRRNMSPTSRLPDEIENKLQEQVNEFIQSQLARINHGNALSFRVYPALDFRNLAIVEKVTALGQNTLTLQNQLEDCNRMIRVETDKLEKYEKQDSNGNSTKDYAELIKATKERLTKLGLVKHHITETLKETAKVTS